MTGHPRLFRCSAPYYHRAAIPVDIKVSYRKTEETFSLCTTDYQEAVWKVRIEAVRVGALLDRCRAEIKKLFEVQLQHSNMIIGDLCASLRQPSEA